MDSSPNTSYDINEETSFLSFYEIRKELGFHQTSIATEMSPNNMTTDINYLSPNN